MTIERGLESGAHASATTPSTMFEERSEHVYFLAPEQVSTFVERVSERLGVEFVHGRPASVPAPTAHYLTTLYFDSDTQAIARACASGDPCMKLRARQYCDHDPEFGIQREPLLWLEVKTRTGATTRKLRVAIPADEVQACLRDGVIDEATLLLRRRGWAAHAEPVLQAIADLCRRTGPLEPDCLAHYRRQAWQDVGETLRITLDTELGFHRARPNSFEGGRVVVTGPPLAQLAMGLVEIKLRGDSPAWLCQLIADIGLEPARVGPCDQGCSGPCDDRPTFSKFLAASRAVHSNSNALAAIP